MVFVPWMFPKTDWLMRFVARLLELKPALTPAAAVMIAIEVFDKAEGEATLRHAGRSGPIPGCRSCCGALCRQISSKRMKHRAADRSTWLDLVAPAKALRGRAHYLIRTGHAQRDLRSEASSCSGSARPARSNQDSALFSRGFKRGVWNEQRASGISGARDATRTRTPVRLRFLSPLRRSILPQTGGSSPLGRPSVSSVVS